MNTGISLILVTFNSADLLPGFFAALATAGDPFDQLIVVDNQSHDTTLRYLAEQQPQVRVIANADNVGFGRACNQGAALAHGSVLVFLNPDLRPLPGWLRVSVAHLLAEPQAAIICPQTVQHADQGAERPAARQRGSAETDDGRRTTDDGRKPPTVHRPLSTVYRLPSATTRPTAAVPGCALMIKRAAWDALGGFDYQIFLYWEDVELCWRAWLCGWQVLEDLVAVVVHPRGGSAGGRRWDAELTRNGLYTYLKLMRWRRVLPFAALLAIKTVAKALRYRPPGLLAAWGWNLRHLPATLAQRRQLMRQRKIDARQLERMIDQHTRRTQGRNGR